jgi:hypothetical protein
MLSPPDHRQDCKGRVGMVMKATPFFSKATHAVEARTFLLNRLAPVALINLSYPRREDLFPDAVGPALLFFAGCALVPDPERLLVGSIPSRPSTNGRVPYGTRRNPLGCR